MLCYHNPMRTLVLCVDGKRIEAAEGTRISEVLPAGKDLPYSGDPVVASKVNGSLMSLTEPLHGNASIESIHLLSPLGKRVYRKTLCFLLSYASSVVTPDRTLIIGHSLGDGYYFRYRNGEKPPTEALRSVMQQAIDADDPITIEEICHDEAVSYAKAKGLRETEVLLGTLNRSSYRFARLGDCFEMYYEPLLPSLSLLTLWELRDYEDGLLLRYPQMRNPFSIMPFTDNPLLFSVFRENKEYASILGIESIGDLNRKVQQGKAKETILLSEALQRRRISDISRSIHSRGGIKAVFIAGPSSSGKTTFSLKLSDELRVDGYRPVKISLDDYYLPTEKVPVDENGEKDYEVLEALDLGLFRKQLDALIGGEEVHLASFSFKDRKTTFRKESVRMEENTILIIEGIHGLNPALIPELPHDLCYRIYISALTQVNLDSRSRISTTDNRILRRMIRDNRTRGFDAVETLSRWPSVERGEKNHIFPYQNNADAMINSALEYEMGVLKPYALPLLCSVPKEEGDAYTLARRLLGFLDYITPIPSDHVPDDSILREFIGGSAYWAI